MPYAHDIIITGLGSHPRLRELETRGITIVRLIYDIAEKLPCANHAKPNGKDGPSRWDTCWHFRI